MKDVMVTPRIKYINEYGMKEWMDEFMGGWRNRSVKESKLDVVRFLTPFAHCRTEAVSSRISRINSWLLYSTSVGSRPQFLT